MQLKRSRESFLYQIERHASLCLILLTLSVNARCCGQALRTNPSVINGIDFLKTLIRINFFTDITTEDRALGSFLRAN